MALGALTGLTTGSASTTSSNTASVSPTAGAVVLVGVELQGSQTITVSGLGGGATWAEITTATYTDGTAWRASVWRAVGTFTTGAITIAQNTGANNFRAWNVCQITGANTTTPVPNSNFIAGSVLPNATTLTLTLPSAFADASNNAAVGFFSHRVNEAFTAGAGFTLIQQTNVSSPASVHSFETKIGQDLTVDVTWPTNTRGAVGVAFELAAAGGGAQALAGTVAATSNVSGNLLVTHPLAGTIAATSTVTGDLLVGKLMNGTVTAVSTVTGDLTVTHTLAGTIAAVSTVSGALTVDYALAGTIAATSTVTGDLSAGKVLQGTIAATSTVTGDLLVSHPLAGTIAATSTVTGDLTVNPTAIVELPLGTVTVLSEKPYICQVSDERPYHVAVVDEQPYSVTVIDEVGD